MEFGCIKHQTHEYIGASPDGVNIDESNPRFGRMLEIKNVFSIDFIGLYFKCIFYIKFIANLFNCYII